jgi:hypothetical protein
MLIPPVQWAQNEFALAELGDERLNKHLVKIATNLAASPGGTLPRGLPGIHPLGFRHGYQFAQLGFIQWFN